MTAPPGNFADRPATSADLLGSPQEFAGPPALEDAALGLDADGQSHDLLSELLRSVRLSGERIVSYAPSRTFSIGFADMGSLHIIEEGELVLRIDGDPHVKHVSRGDFVLLPRGDTHYISDADKRAQTIEPAGAAENDAPEPARWLCGTFTIGDPRASHLLGSLPAVIIMRGARSPALEGLEVARRMLVLEMQSPSQGSAVMVARILDLIFIQILRAWAASADAEPNWLAGAFDPQIGLALSAIHRDPGHDWTVEELARACSLSRSAFAARFVTRVGKPPATYLAHVRLDAATDLLRDTFLPVALIAKNVGYASDRHSAARSRTATARHQIAGDETYEVADDPRHRQLPDVPLANSVPFHARQGWAARSSRTLPRRFGDSVTCRSRPRRASAPTGTAPPGHRAEDDRAAWPPRTPPRRRGRAGVPSGER